MGFPETATVGKVISSKCYRRKTPHYYIDPEAGGFYVFADSEKSQREFAFLLSSILKDIPILEFYLKTADKSNIDD